MFLSQVIVGDEEHDVVHTLETISCKGQQTKPLLAESVKNHRQVHQI